jgi:two-component system response regulator FixJ
MKAGATDFIEKPFSDHLLLATVEAAFAQTESRASRERIVQDAEALIGMLTARERQVLEGILAGRLTKMIAHDLGISIRTVEVHRARILERLGINSMAKAIRLAAMAGLGDAAE